MSIPAAPQFNGPVGGPAPSDPSDLSKPLYGASMGQAFKRFFKKYATFSGRASRSEYWWTQLAIFLIELIPYLLVMISMGIGAAKAGQNETVRDLGYGYTQVERPGAFENHPGLLTLFIIGMILLGVFSLAIIIPSLALTWRRLHDANLAGPMFFLGIIPFVGPIIVFVFTLLGSKPEGQRFDR